MFKKPFVLAHRGISDIHLENTLPAFKCAFEIGAHGIEFDVHKCKTGEIVVFHDFTLNRLTSDISHLHSPLISDLSLAQLKSIPLLDGSLIPTLDEVLTFIAPYKPNCINIELKGDDTAIAVFNTIKEYIATSIFDPKQFLISSFKSIELQKFISLSEEFSLKIDIGLLLPPGLTGLNDLTLTDFLSTKAIALMQNIKNWMHGKLMLIMHHQQLLDKISHYPVVVYGIETQNQCQHCLKMDIIGIITDYPNIFIS